jgi:amino-acid N-acetyltransferase
LNSTSTDMTLPRRATAADWPALQVLLQTSQLPLEGAQAHLAHYLVVDGEAGTLAACAGVELYGRVGLLRSVAVAPRAQGQGLARRLVRQLVDDAIGRGLQGLYLLTTTAPDYFARLGFTRQALADAPAALQASAELQGACPASAVFMALRLEASKP